MSTPDSCAHLLYERFITHTKPVVAHPATEITVVYTNDEREVVRTLHTYRGLLARDEHKFIRLDFEYTSDQHEVAVVQLALRKHILVF